MRFQGVGDDNDTPDHGDYGENDGDPNDYSDDEIFKGHESSAPRDTQLLGSLLDQGPKGPGEATPARNNQALGLDLDA